jgi:hypothetical protein
LPLILTSYLKGKMMENISAFDYYRTDNPVADVIKTSTEKGRGKASRNNLFNKILVEGGGTS